jgi:hypothetical protein
MGGPLLAVGVFAKHLAVMATRMGKEETFEN